MVTRFRATGMPIRDVRRYAALVRQGDGNEAERLALLLAHREVVERQLAEVTSATCARSTTRSRSTRTRSLRAPDRLTSSALEGEGWTHMTIQTATARHHLVPHRLRPRPRLHGDVGVLRHRPTKPRRSPTHPPRARARRDLPGHRRHVRPVHNEQLRRPRDRRAARRGRSSPPSSATCATPDGTCGRRRRPPRVRPQGLRRLAERLGVDHIDLYYQHRVDPDRADRGDRRRDGRARGGGEGAPPRPLRGRRRTTIRRAARGTSDHRGADASTRCGPATSRTTILPTLPRARHRLRAVLARSGAASSPARSAADDLGRTTSAAPPRASGRATSDATSARRRRWRHRRRAGLHAGAARARLGARAGRRRRGLRRLLRPQRGLPRHRGLRGRARGDRARARTAAR